MVERRAGNRIRPDARPRAGAVPGDQAEHMGDQGGIRRMFAQTFRPAVAHQAPPGDVFHPPQQGAERVGFGFHGGLLCFGHGAAVQAHTNTVYHNPPARETLCLVQGGSPCLVHFPHIWHAPVMAGFFFTAWGWRRLCLRRTVLWMPSMAGSFTMPAISTTR